MEEFPGWMTTLQELQGLGVVELRSCAMIDAQHLHAEVLEGHDQAVVDLDPAEAGGRSYPQPRGGQ